MTVEVVSRELPPTKTSIPVALAEYLTDQGKRWSWQYKPEENLSLIQTDGLTPLTIQDLEQGKAPEEVLEACGRGSLGDVRLSLEAGDTGRFVAGDCVLCIQPVEIYNKQQAEIDQRRRQREDGAAFVNDLEHQLQDLYREAGHEVRGPMLAEGGRMAKASSAVNVNKNIVAAEEEPVHPNVTLG